MDLIERTLSKEVHFYTFDELGPFQTKLFFFVSKFRGPTFSKMFYFVKGTLKVETMKNEI